MTERNNFYDKQGQLTVFEPLAIKLSLLKPTVFEPKVKKLPSGAKPTLAARVEDKFICIIPCKKEENEVKSRPKGIIFAISESRVKLACAMLSEVKITTEGSNFLR